MGLNIPINNVSSNVYEVLMLVLQPDEYKVAYNVDRTSFGSIEVKTYLV